MSKSEWGVTGVEEGGNSFCGGFLRVPVVEWIDWNWHRHLLLCLISSACVRPSHTLVRSCKLGRRFAAGRDVSHSSLHSCVRGYIHRVGASSPPKNSSHTSSDRLRLSQICNQRAWCAVCLVWVYRKVFCYMQCGYVFAWDTTLVWVSWWKAFLCCLKWCLKSLTLDWSGFAISLWPLTCSA